MTLSDQVNEKSREIQTDGYPMSIGELSSMYKDGELDIHPEFQRVFRWSIVQKSKLIESILIGIPLPSIFVSQRDDGVWDVIDGLQRLSTIFEFMGILLDEKGEKVKSKPLVSTPHLTLLENKMWDSPDSSHNEIESNLKLQFKRVKIDVKIVKKQSDKNIKYELFQRINTLGSRLSDQEVRNCLLIMINKPFYDWLDGLANYQPFLDTISLGERLIKEQYHLELALRFFIYIKIDFTEIRGVDDLSEFITNKMVQYASSTDFNFNSESELFCKTFSFINDNIGEDAFKKFNTIKKEFQGRFLLSMFECIAIGIGKNIRDSDKKIKVSKIKEKVASVWENDNFLGRSGSGVSVSSRLPVLIPLGENLFK